MGERVCGHRRLERQWLGEAAGVGVHQAFASSEEMDWVGDWRRQCGQWVGREGTSWVRVVDPALVLPISMRKASYIPPFSRLDHGQCRNANDQHSNKHERFVLVPHAMAGSMVAREP
jgi:hypothetical protein